jgi:cytochrome c biogenesis protein CcdA
MSNGDDQNEPLNDPVAKIEIVVDQSNAGEAKRGATDPPRLGVAHLLLWTACCAALLGAARLLAEKPAGVVGAAFLAAVAIGAGTACTGLAVTLARMVGGRSWPIEPGQWLRVALGAASLRAKAGQWRKTWRVRRSASVLGP